MKKIVLLMGLSLLATMGWAQPIEAEIIVQGQGTGPLAINYDHTFTVPGTMWGVPDLTDPANSVLAETMLVDNGDGLTNPQSCIAAVNDLTGKIAVLYRGNCEFGLKAFNAQEAGAVAVLMINNLGGAAVAMGGGASGIGVTIPVVMISNVDGAAIRDAVDAGGFEMFIGTKNGLFANDLGILPTEYLRPAHFGNVQAYSQNATEFNVELGAYVKNFGTNEQTGAVLNVKIEFDGSEIYNFDSDPFILPALDSVFVAVDDFDQATYANGYYDITYTIILDGVEDESDYDNVQEADFYMSEETYSLASLDPVTEEAVNTTNIFIPDGNTRYDCVFFQDPNASRMGARGFNFSVGTSQNPDPTSTEGQLVGITVKEWNDEWIDLDDTDLALDELDDIVDQEYIFTENLQSAQVYVPYDEPFLLEDDKRYLFCLQSYGSSLFHGFDTEIAYNTNNDRLLQPSAVVYGQNAAGDLQWFAGGSANGQVASISLDLFPAAELSLVELPKTELTAFPNPANQIIHIPLAGKEGNATMTITDLSGKVVGTQNVVMTGAMLDVDVTALPAGMYAFNLSFDNGETGVVKVLVSK